MILNDKPITSLKGVGAKLAEKLAKLSIFSIFDLLLHLPLRYQDRTQIAPLGSLSPQQSALVSGQVTLADIAYGRRRSLVVKINDGTGWLTLRFFHFTAQQKAQFSPSTLVRCYGEVRPGISGLEMIHPEYEVGDGANHTEAYLTPIYPTTEGLTQKRLRQLIHQAIDNISTADTPSDPLFQPEHPYFNIPLIDALITCHRANDENTAKLLLNNSHPVQRRLAFEELLAYHLSLGAQRQRLAEYHAPKIKPDNAKQRQLLANLPFQPTTAQLRVHQEIVADLAARKPMLRLLQGDVGSGKTLVAAMAALHCLANGLQVALMAPTEILAQQHARTISQWFTPLNFRCGLLLSKLKAKDKQQLLEDIASGDISLVIGTQALFQKSVEFNRLGLIIVDEQHRFGVDQRLQLLQKGHSTDQRPHQLIMTATPIPRTMSMTLYADLDCSIIDQMPSGRQPIETVAIAVNRRPEVISRIQLACHQGRQAYWVCTLIDESDNSDSAAAEAVLKELKQSLPELHISLIHGRMKSEEKVAVMQSFQQGEVQLLVATTVIEVGVDVPNASVMIIENAERLGLAQLHQLRGRVGRGSADSYCVLMYQKPLSDIARERLQVMRESQDGFYIAERDMQLRGPGELMGIRQTGLASMKIADLSIHADLLEDIKEEADRLRKNFPNIIPILIQRWVGDTSQYASV